MQILGDKINFHWLLFHKISFCGSMIWAAIPTHW